LAEAEEMPEYLRDACIDIERTFKEVKKSLDLAYTFSMEIADIKEPEIEIILEGTLPIEFFERFDSELYRRGLYAFYVEGSRKGIHIWIRVPKAYKGGLRSIKREREDHESKRK